MALSGIISPNLTPFNDDLSVAEDLYVRHAQWLFEQGCSTIAPFGTTGEALSLSTDERIRLLQLLVDSGLSAESMLVGAGLNNFPDTLELSRHAMGMGCAGVMVLPPFYFKAVDDEGLFRYFEKLVSDFPAIRIYLYHIPPVAVVGFSIELVSRLVDTFPEQIVGLKDSSGDWDNTRAVLEVAPGIATFPGSESNLLKALRHGASGCITATANINAALIRNLFDHWMDENADERQTRISAMRSLIEGYAPIPAMKWLLADASGDARWRNIRPPLLPIKDKPGKVLKQALVEQFGFHLD